MTKEAIKTLQTALNEKGAGLVVDGIAGPKTLAAIEKYKAAEASTVKVPTPSGDFFGAPWIGSNLDLLGKEESDAALNARYVPEWALEGLPGYKTLTGNTHAWCSLRANADLRKAGVKGTNSAAAASWSPWGKQCPFWFGAILPIKHSSGGRHVANFLYWIDESKKLAATLDGNRGNRFAVNVTNLSGSGDTLVGGPRWPSDRPDGRQISKADVLAKYPMLKVGGAGESTT